MPEYLDTRDLAKRKEELESWRDALAEAESALTEAKRLVDEAEDEDQTLEESAELAEEERDNAKLDFGEDEEAELKELEELESEVGEWRHGETLIPVDDFEDYARQLAEDIGSIKGDEGWPLNHIDWKAAADELTSDYSEVEYQGTSYYVRN